MASSPGTTTAAFAQRVGRAMSAHVEIMLAALGEEHGFFRDLAKNGPGTVKELAERNGVNERYLREWLNGMVAAQYLTFDSNSHAYAIPKEHVPVLAHEYGEVSQGGMLSMLSNAEAVLPRVSQCFKTGGGVPYSEYSPAFWKGLERHTGCNFENRLLSWLELMDPSVVAKLTQGVRVCDVGCGNGRALHKLAKQYPNSTFIGYDILAHAVKEANERAQQIGLKNLSFAQIETTMHKLPSDELFDIIFVFDVIHDSADPLALLKAIRRSVKADGIFECLDIKCYDNATENPVFAYGMSLLYCMTTSLHQNGVGLGTLGLTESVMKELCESAGFTGGVRRLDIKHPFNTMWEVKPTLSSCK